MQVSPAHLITLLRARGIRVEVEELLRLHEALQGGADWTPQRLENVVVGILATCPEDPPKIRDAVRELRRAAEPEVDEPTSRTRAATRRRGARPTPLVSRRVVVTLALGGAASAAGTVAWLMRARPPAPAPTSDAEAPPSPASRPTPTNSGSHEPATPPSPPEPKPGQEEPWVAEERARQEAHRAAEVARREEEAAVRSREIADIDATRTTRRAPLFVPARPAWRRLLGAALLGPAAATGAIAWFAHRAWRRRLAEERRFGGSALEVAPGPSLFWLAPRQRRWPPLLGIEAREALVWGVGEAASADPTRFLDEDATIDATIEHGGMPELRFRRKRRLRRVWLWHDQGAVGPMAAQLCAEVHETLHGYGLAVEVGRYGGLPERLERDDGRVLSLDALDEERESSTVIVLTDGAELLRRWEWRDASGHSRQPRVRALLRQLAAWPHLTFVHTGDRAGFGALRTLLEPFGIPCAPIEGFPLAVREREHLAAALAATAPAEQVWIWAALCALYPLPVPEALALELLRDLSLPISPLSIGHLIDQSVATAGIQFAPPTRARLIERLRRSLEDASGSLPPTIARALAFWRARTIAGEEDWERDTTGRGIHRRLVVALLDLWTDPERAAGELSALRRSPHMPAIREELARMRPAGNRSAPPEPGSFHVPVDAATLSPTARTRLQAAGMGGLAAVETGGERVRWPWWLRGLVALSTLLLIAGVALLAVEATTRRVVAVGEWRDIVGPLPEVEIATIEVPCAAEDGLRRCLGPEADAWTPARRVAILDAGPDEVDAVRFADALLDRGLVEAAWIDRWPAWIADGSVRALPEARGLEVWVFSLDPEFVPPRAGEALERGPRYPSIVGGSTGRVVAADFCGDAICAVTQAEGVVRLLRGEPGGTTVKMLGGSGKVTDPVDRPHHLWNARFKAGQEPALIVWTSTVAGVTDSRTVDGVVFLGHEDVIVDAALSLDGRRAATASWDQTARIWDTGSGDELVAFRGHEGHVSAVAFSPDGSHVVTGSEDRSARVWKSDGTGESIALRGHEGPVVSVQWSFDGRQIVTASKDRTARVWNADGTGEPVVFRGHEEGLDSATFSPDGRRVVTTSKDGTARVWNTDGTGEPVVLREHRRRSLLAAWHPDGKRVVTGCKDEDVARVWDAATGDELAVLRHGSGPGLTQVRVSPDGATILTASGTGTVRVWNADGRPVSPRAEASADVLTALGDLGDSPVSRTVFYRSTDWRRLIASFADDQAGMSPAFRGRDRAPPLELPAGYWASTSLDDGDDALDIVAIVEVPQDPRALLVTGTAGRVTAAAATGRGALLVGTSRGEVQRWTATNEPARDLSPHTRPVVGFVAGGDAILSVDERGAGRQWSDDGPVSRALDVEQIKLATASLDRTGAFVVTSGGEVLLLDRSGAGRLTVQTWGSDVVAVASRTAGEVALISDGELHRCVNRGEWECRPLRIEAAPRRLAASPIEGEFATVSDELVPTISLLAEGVHGFGPAMQARSRFRGPIGWPVALRFAPDGTRVAVASLDGTVRLANTRGEGCPRVLRHETPLADIAFSPDGALLATGSFDADVRVYRVADGAGPVRLAGHRGPVRSVEFLAAEAVTVDAGPLNLGTASDAPRILSVSDDGTARVWEAPALAAFEGFAPAEELCVEEPSPPPPPPPAPVESVEPGESQRPAEVCQASPGDNACERCVKKSCCAALLRCQDARFAECTTSIQGFESCGKTPTKCSALRDCTFLGKCGVQCQPNE